MKQKGPGEAKLKTQDFTNNKGSNSVNMTWGIRICLVFGNLPFQCLVISPMTVSDPTDKFETQFGKNMTVCKTKTKILLIFTVYSVVSDWLGSKYHIFSRFYSKESPIINLCIKHEKILT